MARRQLKLFNVEPDPRADNVRPMYPDVDPKTACTGGRGEYRVSRGLSANCATCGFGGLAGGHCPLLERCDRCGDDDNPCPATVAINAELGW